MSLVNTCRNQLSKDFVPDHLNSYHSLMSNLSKYECISKDSITNNENTLSLEDMGSMTQQSSIGNEESKQEVRFLVGNLNYNSNTTSKSSQNNSKSLEPMGFNYQSVQNMIKNHKKHKESKIMVSPRNDEDPYYVSYEKFNPNNILHQLSSKLKIKTNNKYRDRKSDHRLWINRSVDK